MKVLLLGGYGQLGTAFRTLFQKENIDYVAPTREVDISNILEIEKIMFQEEISHLINCAAYNQVDKAEQEPLLCFRINTEAPYSLALLAKKHGAKFLTFSTDFVFNGSQKTPYVETDITCPLNRYGMSKWLGEEKVLSVNRESVVIRTSWVFGLGKSNFVDQVLSWSQGKNHLKIVDDQFSSPTYTEDLAWFSWQILLREKGLYHFSNHGVCSKKEQAEYLLSRWGWQGIVEGVSTAFLSLAAPRAPYTKLDSTKLETVLQIKIPTWQSGVDRYLKQLKERVK